MGSCTPSLETSHWQHILFSDESRFSLRFSDGRYRVYHRRGEHFMDQCVYESRQFWRWKCYGLDWNLSWCTQLKIVQGTLNAVKYRDDILDSIVLPFLQQQNVDHVFQHDNARSHMARVVKIFWTRITSMFFLGRHYHRICHQLNIDGMNSVDVFATVIIHRKHHRSCMTHLCMSGTTSHKPLSNDWLIGSMHRRCEAVVAVKGGHTRYWTPQTSILHENSVCPWFVLIMMLRNFVDFALFVMPIWI